MPVANPITFHKGRLLAGECRVGGRIMELDLDGGAPRVILDNVPMPNAFEVGPDGKLYIPVMGTNEIWRVSLDGGRSEEHTSELQSLMRISYAVFCLKKKNNTNTHTNANHIAA